MGFLARLVGAFKQQQQQTLAGAWWRREGRAAMAGCGPPLRRAGGGGEAPSPTRGTPAARGRLHLLHLWWLLWISPFACFQVDQKLFFFLTPNLILILVRKPNHRFSLFRFISVQSLRAPL